MTRIEVPAITHLNEVLTDESDVALIIDWFDWDNQPESFVELLLGNGWEQVQCDLESINANVGRDLTDEPVETGTATLRLRNVQGKYSDLTNEASALPAGTPIRIRLRHPTHTGSAAGETVIWHGYLYDWSQEWTKSTDTIVVTAVDAISFLAEQGGTLGWKVGSLGDSVYQRLDHLLERVGQAKLTYFQQGDIEMVNPEVEEQSVIDEVHLTELSDGGHFFAEATHSGVQYVYLNRTRWGSPPPPIRGAIPGSKAQPTMLDPILAERVLWTGGDRRGQDVIPLFSDWCTDAHDGMPYTDLDWKWRAWERPSVVAVSNVLPPDRNVLLPDGTIEEVDPPWEEVGALALTKETRHKVAEFTDLRMRRQVEADRLAVFYAEVLTRSNLDVTRLEVIPDVHGIDNDTRVALWDAVAGQNQLRQGDWVRVQRHLQTHQFIVTARVEGIEWELTPPISGGQPIWKVTYRLHSLRSHSYPIPPEQRPPRPPGVPVEPPLPDPIPALTMVVNSFTVKSNPAYLIDVSVTDTIRPPGHIIKAYNPTFGTVTLKRLSLNQANTVFTYTAAETLGPGEWIVWATDETNEGRTSNQGIVTVPDLTDLTATLTNWAPTGTGSKITVVDTSVPLSKPRLFAKGREGTIELPITSFTYTGGDKNTGTGYVVGFDASKLLPDDWEFYVVDAGDINRKSNIVAANKATPVPTGLRLGAFNPSGEDNYAYWADIPIVWNTVPNADRYRIEYRDVSTLGDGTWRTRSEETPSSFLRGGDSRRDAPSSSRNFVAAAAAGQTARIYDVKVSAQVNGQWSTASAVVRFNSGYPGLIARYDFHEQHGGSTISAGLNQMLAIRVQGQRLATWQQNTNPDKDNFVGLQMRRMRFKKLRSVQRLTGAAGVLKRLMPDDSGGFDIRIVTNDRNREQIPSNPTVPWDGSWSVDMIGNGYYGIKPAGWKWGTVGGTNSTWIEADEITIEGYSYRWHPPLYPKVVP